MAASYEERIARVLRHIHEDPAGDLSLDRLAEVGALSRFHLPALFLALTGETCARAVRRVRMHRAAVALVNGETPLGEIAAESGYASTALFARAFRADYGRTPAAFRERGVLIPPLLAMRRGEHPMFPVEISEEAPRRVAALAHSGAYSEIGRTFDRLGAVLAARDLWRSALETVGIYYDDPATVPAESLRSHAGIVVGDAVDISEPLEELHLPGGRYAVMHYRGPYAGLAGAYRHLYGVWLPQSGEEAADHPPIEVYLNDPGKTDPADLLTDILVPLHSG